MPLKFNHAAAIIATTKGNSLHKNISCDAYR